MGGKSGCQAAVILLLQPRLAKSLLAVRQQTAGRTAMSFKDDIGSHAVLMSSLSYAVRHGLHYGPVNMKNEHQGMAVQCQSKPGGFHLSSRSSGRIPCLELPGAPDKRGE